MQIKYSECQPWTIKHKKKLSTRTCFYYTHKKSKPFIKHGGITSGISLGVIGPIDRWYKIYNRHRNLRANGLRLSSSQIMNLYLEDN